MKTESKEMLDYVEYEDKHGYKTKVVNFDNPKMCPREGVIEIKAIRITNRHENRKSFSFTTDPSTGIKYGIPMGVDPKTGDMKFKRIIIYNSMQLNLKNPEDAKLWTVISRCEFLKGSPMAKGKPEYEVFDREAEAQIIIVENKSKRRAAKIIDDLSQLEMYDMARNCGLSVENDSPALVQSLLYKKSENNPGEFLEIWDNINRPVLTVFKRGLITGLIRFDLNKGYIWKESLQLGANDSAVVRYLLSNISLLVTMDSETKERDNIFKQNATNDDYKKSILEALGSENSSPINTYTPGSLSKENDETKKRLSEKEEQLNSALEEMKEMKEMMRQIMSPKVEIPKNTTDDELEDLRKEAGKMGMKGANLMKDKDKLRKYISDQKEIIEG